MHCKIKDINFERLGLYFYQKEKLHTESQFEKDKGFREHMDFTSLQVIVNSEGLKRK